MYRERHTTGEMLFPLLVFTLSSLAEAALRSGARPRSGPPRLAAKVVSSEEPPSVGLTACAHVPPEWRAQALQRDGACAPEDTRTSLAEEPCAKEETRTSFVEALRSTCLVAFVSGPLSQRKPARA